MRKLGLAAISGRSVLSNAEVFTDTASSGYIVGLLVEVNGNGSDGVMPLSREIFNPQPKPQHAPSCTILNDLGGPWQLGSPRGLVSCKTCQGVAVTAKAAGSSPVVPAILEESGPKRRVSDDSVLGIKRRKSFSIFHYFPIKAF
jgi:hypothetical protein